jgi:hypothetical protein
MQLQSQRQVGWMIKLAGNKHSSIDAGLSVMIGVAKKNAG